MSRLVAAVGTSRTIERCCTVPPDTGHCHSSTTVSRAHACTYDCIPVSRAELAGGAVRAGGRGRHRHVRGLHLAQCGLALEQGNSRRRALLRSLTAPPAASRSLAPPPEGGGGGAPRRPITKSPQSWLATPRDQAPVKQPPPALCGAGGVHKPRADGRGRGAHGAAAVRRRVGRALQHRAGRPHRRGAGAFSARGCMPL